MLCILVNFFTLSVQNIIFRGLVLTKKEIPIDGSDWDFL
jgi:hypothetical protein